MGRPTVPLGGWGGGFAPGQDSPARSGRSRGPGLRAVGRREAGRPRSPCVVSAPTFTWGKFGQMAGTVARIVARIGPGASGGKSEGRRRSGPLLTRARGGRSLVWCCTIVARRGSSSTVRAWLLYSPGWRFESSLPYQRRFRRPIRPCPRPSVERSPRRLRPPAAAAGELSQELTRTGGGGPPAYDLPLEVDRVTRVGHVTVEPLVSLPSAGLWVVEVSPAGN